MAKVYRVVPQVELAFWQSGDIDAINRSGLAREFLYEPHVQKSPDMIARLQEKYGSVEGICFFENLDFTLWLQSFGWREKMSIALISIEVPDEVLQDCLLIGKYKRDDNNFNIALEYYLPKEVLKKCLKNCKIMQYGEKEYDELLKTCAELRKNPPFYPIAHEATNSLVMLGENATVDVREDGYGKAFGKYYPLVTNFEFAVCFPNMEFIKQHINEIDFKSQSLGLDLLELARKYHSSYINKDGDAENFVVPKKEDMLIEQVATFCAKKDVKNCSQEEIDKFIVEAANKVLSSLCKDKKIDLQALEEYQKEKALKSLSPEELKRRKMEYLAKRAENTIVK